MEERHEPRRSGATALEIAEALIADIKSGALPHDDPLPTERALCERFGASRPTVREALTHLHLRGYTIAGAGRRPRAARPSLVQVLRGAGMHIREILGDARSGAHLEQMRQFIETGAAREAALRATNVQIADLRAALERNAEAIGDEAFAATDIAFHRVLVSVVGNPVLLTLHDMFVSELLRVRPRADDRVARDRQSHDEHRRIYEAILDGDAVTATAIMDRHLERSYRDRLRAVPLATDRPDEPQAEGEKPAGQPLRSIPPNT
ncbi:MAG: FCD domain-containing protein [Geminicoccaceae bacterium]|nr:FCD domain-containing protein [Geminicoccaceae bacterium]